MDKGDHDNEMTGGWNQGLQVEKGYKKRSCSVTCFDRFSSGSKGEG